MCVILLGFMVLKLFNLVSIYRTDGGVQIATDSKFVFCPKNKEWALAFKWSRGRVLKNEGFRVFVKL